MYFEFSLSSEINSHNAKWKCHHFLLCKYLHFLQQKFCSHWIARNLFFFWINTMAGIWKNCSKKYYASFHTSETWPKMSIKLFSGSETALFTLSLLRQDNLMTWDQLATSRGSAVYLLSPNKHDNGCPKKVIYWNNLAFHNSEGKNILYFLDKTWKFQL